MYVMWLKMSCLYTRWIWGNIVIPVLIQFKCKPQYWEKESSPIAVLFYTDSAFFSFFNLSLLLHEAGVSLCLPLHPVLAFRTSVLADANALLIFFTLYFSYSHPPWGHWKQHLNKSLHYCDCVCLSLR